MNYKVVFADKNRSTQLRAKSEEDINKMIEMWNEGHSQREVADKFGVSIGTVKRYFRDRREAEKMAESKDEYIKYLENRIKVLEKGSD